MLKRKTISKKDLEKLVRLEKAYYCEKCCGYRAKGSLGILFCDINMSEAVVKERKRYIEVEDGDFPYCPKLDYFIPDFCFVDWWNCRGVKL